jgi:hypothetical protein
MTPVKDMENVTSTASSEALELLGCFYNGIDDLVYQIAEDVARAREGASRAADRPVQIEVADVKQAGDKVLAALRDMVKMGTLPADAGPALDAMKTCFETNAQ